MEKYDYRYAGSEAYCYPGTDVLKNKLGIRNDEALAIAEREITSLKILKQFNMPIAEQFNFDALCQIHKTIFEDILDFSSTKKEELLAADIAAFNGQYEKLIQILTEAIPVK